MQSKKIEIDEKIREVALEQFYKSGFLNANLRDIAAGCHITVGNIYRYYPSKAGLFESLLEPVYSELNHLTILDIDYFINSLQSPNSGGLIYQVIRHFLINNAKLLIVLIHRSEGSKYENAKTRLIDLIANSLAKAHEIKNIDITKLYANLIISGMTAILADNLDDPTQIDNYCIKVLPAMLRTVKEAAASI